MQATILVVEDECLCGMEIQESLEKAGHRVPEVLSSGDEVLGAVLRHKPDLVVMDINLKSYIDGIDAASRLRMVRPTPVIYVTAYPEKGTEDRARRTEPFAYLQNPLEEGALADCVERALAAAGGAGSASLC